VLSQGWSVAEAAEAAGLSKRTGYKWLQRHKAEGLSGLTDRSSCPHRQPSRTSKAQEDQIVALRFQRMTGGEIAWRLAMPRSTVARILKRAGLARLRSLEPPPPVQRYEKEHPGELLHLDIKKLGRIRGVGHRITGDRRDTSPGAGWEYVHVCVDDHSRLAYVEVLPDERQGTATGFLERAVAWYAKHGIQTRRILTDNGNCYRSHRFNAACTRLAVRHGFTRPYRPQTNGKAERLIQTLLREWAYRFAYPSSRRRRQRLHTYLHFYNWHRQHTSLNRMAPASRLPPVNNLMGLHS
jgi:transposase InsO family protein